MASATGYMFVPARHLAVFEFLVFDMYNFVEGYHLFCLTAGLGDFPLRFLSFLDIRTRLIPVLSTIVLFSILSGRYWLFCYELVP